MTPKMFAPVMLALTLASMVISQVAFADDGCACNHCGCCDQHVRKVCRVICEMKDVKKTKYCMVSEDYCLSEHGEHCNCHYVPSCGCVRTKNKLTKYEEVTRVPTYKCIVEYLCDGCCHECGAAPMHEEMDEEPKGEPMKDEVGPPPAPEDEDAPKSASARRPVGDESAQMRTSRLHTTSYYR